MSPPVIYYHSVAPELFENWVQKFLTQPLADFEAQLQFLREQEYGTVFLDEWMAYRSGQKKVTGKEICIAFDDGLLDNWVYVWPLAKKYGMRFTLFVSPECVSAGKIPRPTLEDVWKGRCKISELNGLGYLNWSEIRAMQDSGLVDIHSHTMTHAKYPVSGKITGFYYGGFPGLHPILNAFPELRPNYMNVPDFESRLSKGTPLFEEKSAVIARRVTISPAFMEEAAQLAARYDTGGPTLPAAYESAVLALRNTYDRQERLLTAVESDEAYHARLQYEILRSKEIIESQLGKTVDFLCWPHGDNTQEAHDMAIAAGYRATTAGKMTHSADRLNRIPRFGAVWSHGDWLNRQKFHYKIASHYRIQPYYTIWLLNEYKNRLLQRN